MAIHCDECKTKLVAKGNTCDVSGIKKLAWSDFRQHTKASGGNLYVAKTADGKQVDLFIDYFHNARMMYAKSGTWLADCNFTDEEPSQCFTILQEMLSVTRSPQAS